MRPCVIVYLLLLSFLLHEAQGIRLEKGFMQAAGDQKLQEEEKSSVLIHRSNGAVGDVILCKDGHCTATTTTGKGSRKLITVTSSTIPTTATTTSKNEKDGGNKAKPMSNGRLMNSGEVDGDHEKSTISTSSAPASENQEVTHDHHVDMMEIAAMDYSPARRKPPIHN